MDVARFVKEDIESADITSEALLGNERAKGQIIAKGDCVLAGCEEAVEVFCYFDLKVDALKKDGLRVKKKDIVLEVAGLARKILAGERLALNFLGRMSGIATQTRKLVDACRKINPNVKVAATRKTTPGFREFEKKAVSVGGGWPHRMRLDDAFLIKDNHLVIARSVEEALKRASLSKYAREGRTIEIEVESMDDAIRAARAGAHIIMLDNMSPERARASFEAIKGINRDILVEVSGGITPKNIARYAACADIISLGFLTHSAPAADFSLDITEVL